MKRDYTNRPFRRILWFDLDDDSTLIINKRLLFYNIVKRLDFYGVKMSSFYCIIYYSSFFYNDDLRRLIYSIV